MEEGEKGGERREEKEGRKRRKGRGEKKGGKKGRKGQLRQQWGPFRIGEANDKRAKQAQSFDRRVNRQ